MSASEQELRQDICEIGRNLWLKGWVAANDGNISVRLDADRLLCTPTGISKGRMQPDDLIVCDTRGNKIQGSRECTTEIAMHLAIYSLRSDVLGVVHAHPPTATGFAAAGRALQEGLLPEVIVGLGCVPLAAYGLPGTSALTEPMLPLIPHYDALLLSNHGAVCYAGEVWRAYYHMETVEHFAHILLVAELAGGARMLPRREVEKLLDSRERYGVKSRAGQGPMSPVTAEDAAAARCRSRSEALAEIIEEAFRARGL